MKLDDAAKTYAVQSQACFDSPATVCKVIRQDFGFEITPQSVEGYDPTKRAGARLSDKWVALFHETRKAFLEDTAAIGISHRAVRLRALNRMADKAETAGNIALALQVHKQAAEEVGNVYTNRREQSGANGGPQDHKITIEGGLPPPE